jgi:hypothetical protein
MLTTHNTLASDNPGLHQTEPQPKAAPEPKAVQIPKFKESVKPEKASVHQYAYPKGKTRLCGECRALWIGGPAVHELHPDGQCRAGEGGLSFGEGGDFGERYGWYVASVRNRISGNWLLSTVSPNIVTCAPPLYDFYYSA